MKLASWPPVDFDIDPKHGVRSLDFALQKWGTPYGYMYQYSVHLSITGNILIPASSSRSNLLISRTSDNGSSPFTLVSPFSRVVNGGTNIVGAPINPDCRRSRCQHHPDCWWRPSQYINPSNLEPIGANRLSTSPIFGRARGLLILRRPPELDTPMEWESELLPERHDTGHHQDCRCKLTLNHLVRRATDIDLHLSMYSKKTSTLPLF